MRKLFERGQSSSSGSQPSRSGQDQPQSQIQPPVPAAHRPLASIAPPSALDVLRYRYHHGTNLGSIFVLERWLSPSMFESVSADDSELGAVKASLQVWGNARTRARWEEHWASAISEIQFKWLVQTAGCTSIRLPVGYWTLGRAFCKGTPFEGPLGDVYGGAWVAVKDFVRRARAWGIGVLVDFHGLPGGANRDAHSGTGSGKAEFWRERKYRDLALRCIRFIVTEFQQMDGVIGLQIVNEAIWDAEGLYEWYEQVLGLVGEIDDSLPVYVSDGWDLRRALEWANGRKWVRNPVVMDTHKYYTFSDKDRSQTPAEIISRIPNELSELDGMDGSISDCAGAQLIVGEYSCVLDGQTWSRVQADERDGCVRQFGRAQSSRWQERAGGAYFWTFKMDWMDGGEWGFVEQVKSGNIVPPPSLLLSNEEVQERANKGQQQRAKLLKDSRASHEDYWNRTCPGQCFEHERYSQGWDVGFSDALSFFVMRADGGLGGGAVAVAVAGQGGDRIGCVELWVKKRLFESGQGGGAFAWEWEQGFRAGVKAFNGIVGI